MTLPSLPNPGATNWYAWASGVHDVAGEIASGRLTEAALDAAYGGVGGGGSYPLVVAAVSTGNTAAQNTTALNAAVAAAASGGTVLIPAGTFAHNGFTLPATGDIAVRGAGRGATVLNNTHATNASVTAHGVGGGTDPTNPYCIDWTLSDLTLTASAVRATQVGVTSHLAVRFRVENVTVEGHGVGIRNNAAWECTYDTVSAFQCTIGWDFSAVITTVSCPVTVVNGSAVVCGTGMRSVGSVECLTWHGGDFAGCSTAGVVLTGDGTRVLSFSGVNFEDVGGDDVIIGDGTTAPTGVTFTGCRFSRPSLVGGTRSVHIIRGGGVTFTGCYWSNVASGIVQDGTAGDFVVLSPSVFNVTTFLTSAAATAGYGSWRIPTPGSITSMGAGGAIAARRHATVDQSVTPPVDFSLVGVTLGGTSLNVGMDVSTANAITVTATGIYLASLAVTFSGGTAGPRVVGLRVNGTVVREFMPPADTNGNFKMSGTDLIDLFAGDVVTMAVYVGGSGTAITIEGDFPRQTSLGLAYQGSF